MMIETAVAWVARLSPSQEACNVALDQIRQAARHLRPPWQLNHAGRTAAHNMVLVQHQFLIITDSLIIFDNIIN